MDRRKGKTHRLFHTSGGEAMKCYEYLLRWGKEKKDDTFYEEDGFSMTWGEALRFVEGEKEVLSALGV